MKTRRDVLKGLGASALLLPTLPSLFSSTARAAAGKPPLRLVFFFSTNGVKDAAFWPSATPTAQVAPGIYSTKLSEIIAQNGQVSQVFGPSFNSLANNFSLIRGIGLSTSPYGADNIVHDGASFPSCSLIHENSDSFGGEAPIFGSSFDCVVENSSSFYQTRTKFSAVRIAGGDPKWSPSFWRPNGGATPPYPEVQRIEYRYDDAVEFFNYLFGSTAASVPAAGPSYRNSVFDKVLLQMDAISKSRAVSSADKERLASHTQYLSQLRNSVVGTGGSAGGTTGGQCTPGTLMSGGNIKTRYQNNLNSIATAFACDLTRVVCYTMTNYDDNGLIGWDNDHGVSHSDDSPEQAALCGQYKGWQASRIADFMQTLSQMKEFNGSSVLDNTLIIWGNQHGGGHCISNYPILVGGGAQGRFRMGEYIDYRDRNNLNDRSLGRPLSNLLMAIMRSMGVPPAEYLAQGQDGAFGLAARPGDGYAQGYRDVVSMRRELIPYFYRGPA